MPHPSFIALVAGALATTLAAAPLGACTCTNERTLEEEFDSAVAVFKGRVTAVAPAGDGLNVIVTLTPLARWKGGLDDPATVVTGENAGLCGVSFQIGVEYLVFAWPTTLSGRPMLFTHLCSRTATAEGNPDIGNLGAPLVPTSARAISWGGLKRNWR